MMNLGKKLAITLFFCLTTTFLYGDAGVLLPRGSTQPNPAILSLEEMQVEIRIDNGDARVFVREIFANHTGSIQEGNYVFAMPSRATISDFAVWDSLTRIPAVILERKRAEEIYNQLTAQRIDPGLLQQGERGADEARHSAAFSARIFPIPSHGTKRMEIEYHESIPVENLRSLFAIPLRPDVYRGLTARKMNVHFELTSAHSIKDFEVLSKTYPFKIEKQDEHSVVGSFSGENVAFTEDFTVRYTLNGGKADSLQVITHRDPNSGTPSPDEMAPVRSTNEPGFFEAEALLAMGSHANAAEPAAPAGAPRTVIALFDNSLSMQWEKLESSYQALESILHSLRATDHFNLILFNSEVSKYSPNPVPGDPATVQRALDFIRASRLRGGSNLELALQNGLEQSKASNGETYIVLLTDGGATRGIINSGKLSAWYTKQWSALPEVHRPRTYIFAVGDDANLQLLRMLARNEGVLENVRSTEPIEFKMQTFLSKIGRSPVAQLHMNASPENLFDMVYELQDNAFAGSMASWVGQYKTPRPKADFSVRGVREGAVANMNASVPLPANSAEHPQLPRLWARARVDALLEKIERDGEDRATIDEIIRLARKYKFVTPYTSFLAVPRSLLRPRIIRPGDPVLRVKTDESIVSVLAMFPFGLVKKLRYLPDEDIWQTRFLAPADMNDGTYNVRMVLRDKNGNVYRENKSFVIASKPPIVRVRLDKTQFRPGQAIRMRVGASELTRTIFARMPGADAVQLRWNANVGSNVGELVVPNRTLPGQYKLTVTAEDIAHNIGSQEVFIEILP
jgi:Ca-activated chloride channel family protein